MKQRVAKLIVLLCNLGLFALFGLGLVVLVSAIEDPPSLPDTFKLIGVLVFATVGGLLVNWAFDQVDRGE